MNIRNFIHAHRCCWAGETISALVAISGKRVHAFSF